MLGMASELDQPAVGFIAGSWGDVFRDIAEWANTHARSGSVPVEGTWIRLEGLLLDPPEDVADGETWHKYSATLLYAS